MTISDLVVQHGHTKATRKNKMKKTLYWFETFQETFGKIKKVMAHDTMLVNPDLTKPFKVYTYASSF